MGRLVELLGIKGGTKAKGDAWAEEDVIGNGCDATVVDLDLFSELSIHSFWPTENASYLGKGNRV